LGSRPLSSTGKLLIVILIFMPWRRAGLPQRTLGADIHRICGVWLANAPA